MSAAGTLPVVQVERTKGRTFADEPVWVVKRCVFCKRRHSHIADPVLTTMILPARCNPSRFYQVREAAK